MLLKYIMLLKKNTECILYIMNRNIVDDNLSLAYTIQRVNPMNFSGGEQYGQTFVHDSVFF